MNTVRGLYDEMLVLSGSDILTWFEYEESRARAVQMDFFET